MKHSVAPQSRKASCLTFFCVVQRVTGICIALGVVVLSLRAQAKANQLGVVSIDVIGVVRAFANQFQIFVVVFFRY